MNDTSTPLDADQTCWKETSAYGKAKARELGIAESDAERLVSEVRHARRAQRTPEKDNGNDQS